MEEIWKTIEGYPNYMVSNMGNVINNKTGRILIHRKVGVGYFSVSLCRNGKKYEHRVNRLVAQAFIPNPENKPEVDHINTNKTDNRVENLRWVTHKENMNNQITIEKRKGENNYLYGKIGIQHHSSKPILQFTKYGEFIKRWDSMSDVKRKLNIPHSNIVKVINGNRKTAGGFKWGKADDYERIPFKVFDLEIYEKKVA